MTFQPAAGFGLLAASLAALALALLGLPLSKGRSYYMTGLASAFVAYGLILLVSVDIELPLLASAALAPAVEEPIRIFTVFVLLSRTSDRGCWLAFALGYALLESSLKLGDNFLLLAHGNDLTRSAALLSIPVVPLMLHIFLGVLAMRLRSLNTPAVLAFIAVLVLHTAHNFSAFALPRPEDWSFALIEACVRSLLFCLLTLLLIK